MKALVGKFYKTKKQAEKEFGRLEKDRWNAGRYVVVGFENGYLIISKRQAEAFENVVE